MVPAVQMPEFYERRVDSSSLTRAAAPSTASTKRPAVANVHEDSDIFRPPDESH